MADLSVLENTTDNNRRLRGTKSGALFTQNWVQQEIANGNGRMVQVGALTTPIVGGGDGTIIDLDQPEVNIGVPNGFVIFPYRVHVQCEVPADQDADVQEIIIGYDRLATNAGGTFTDEQANNLRLDLGPGSVTDPNSGYTADQTTAPTVIELARAQTVTNILTNGVTNKQFELLYEPAAVPGIGNVNTTGAQLLCYWGGIQAMSGFAQVYWIEKSVTDLGW